MNIIDTTIPNNGDKKLSEADCLLSDLTKASANNSFIQFILTKINTIYSEKIKLKTLNILVLLNSTVIPYNLLESLMFSGIPDDIPSLRSLVWRLALNCLPLKTGEWMETLIKSRERYNELKNKCMSTLNIKGKKLRKDDNPLSTQSDSAWKDYFIDHDIYANIGKDILRTKTNMNFVFMPYQNSFTKKVSTEDVTNAAEQLKQNVGMNSNSVNKKFETNADVMNRILFIYAKEHPDVAYVQGMNELLAPLFYCFFNDRNPEMKGYVEEDSYFAFENLMNVIKDIFIRKKDNLDTGINTRLKEIEGLLDVYDFNLCFHLRKNKIKIEYFGYRWMTLFFTQDFEMPDILRLWDSILCDPDIFDFLYMLIMGAVVIRKDKIMKEEMAGIMTTLQNFEGISVVNLIKKAEEIRKILNKKISGKK